MAFLPLAEGAPRAEIVLMFSDHCPRHRRRVLLGPDDIIAVRNDEDGVHVEWRCPCGGRGSYLTGRRRSPAAGV